MTPRDLKHQTSNIEGRAAPHDERPAVTLYTRKDCSLCEDAAALLRDLARDLHFDIDHVDIDAEPALRDRYNDIIPVIALGDRELARAPLDAEGLRTQLERAIASRTSRQ
jgi:glutaredoxin